jgi:hypothetical protein
MGFQSEATSILTQGGLDICDTRRISKIRTAHDAIIIDVLSSYFSQNKWFDHSETIIDMNEVLHSDHTDAQKIGLIFQMASEKQGALNLDVDHNLQEQDFYKMLMESNPYYENNHPDTSTAMMRATQALMKQEIQEITDRKEDNQSKKTDGFTPG